MKEIRNMPQSHIQHTKLTPKTSEEEKNPAAGDGVDIAGKGDVEEKELKKMLDFLKSQGKSKSGCTSCTMGCT